MIANSREFATSTFTGIFRCDGHRKADRLWRQAAHFYAKGAVSALVMGVVVVSIPKGSVDIVFTIFRNR